ncbi:MAG: hypothetical protein FJX46_11400 [Alphaproteobacteria bacterium]|nr:hypothetical protein [Alphaproteobacteria bacterium]
MTDSGRFVTGALMALISLLGLVLAAGAVDAGMEIFGLGLFVFGVLFIFQLIRQAYEPEEN